MAAAKKKMPAIEVPQDDAAADAVLKSYGEHVAALQRLEADMKDALLFAKTLFEAAALPLQCQLDLMEKQLAAFGAAHRERLTEKGKTKTVRMPAGEIGWRNNPPSVRWARGFKIEDIIKNIHAMVSRALVKKDVARAVTLGTLIRTKEEPNKEAMLANPDLAKEIDGVRVVEGEEQFFIAPFGAELAEPKV